MIDQEATTATAPQAGSATISPDPDMTAPRVRKPRRRRSWFGWLGFPKSTKALWHLRQMANHLLSALGFRP